MIKYTELESIFLDVDITIHEYNIETNDLIDLPYVVYIATDGNAFEADGINYFKTLSVGLAIIDETMNFALQRKIEEVFSAHYVSFDKTINFDDDARLYTITYNFEVIDDGANKH